MKNRFNLVMLAGLSLILIVAASDMSIAPGGPPSAKAAASISAPVETPFSAPIDVTNSPLYDNGGAIGASPLDGSVTIGWEQRDQENNRNLINVATNSPFRGDFFPQNADITTYKASGNVKIAHDALGRRHIAFYTYSSGDAAIQYVRVEANGQISVNEVIPGSGGLKLASVAVGPDNTPHFLLGKDNSKIRYFHRQDNGNWDVVNEVVTPDVVNQGQGDVSIAVNTNGLVMAAWKGPGPGSNDIFAATRTGSGSWAKEDISFECCQGCPTASRTYLPSLTADRTGGFRVSWSDEKCDPRPYPDSVSNDIYYREWVPGTGWNNQPLVRVVNSFGHSYQNNLVVDDNNVSHIIWTDTTDSPNGSPQIWYSYGSGTNFSPPAQPFTGWAGGAYLKDMGMDVSPGYVDIVFGSNRDDSQKENYYAYKSIGPVAPPPTPTPIAGPPPCANEYFKDVCRDGGTAPFYTAILNLVNANIISGYNTVPPCPNSSWVPCYLPFNPVTRGQVAKIIALGANLPANLQGAPHFVDVPPGSTFYNYVEYNFNAGTISGYPCGLQPNEPCGPPNNPNNLPYFRPGANVTRGQLSKILSIAFGYNEPATNRQSFQDVPVTSTFYTYIDRLVRRGIIGGYPCGGPSEPCLPPANLPYFRPGNNITRGQVAKVVYIARQQPVATATSTSTATPVPTLTATSTPVISATVTPEMTVTTVPTSTSTAVETSTAVATVTTVATLTATAVPPTVTATATPVVVNVSLINTTFDPMSVTVAAGTTVVWTNNDTRAHTVTSDPGDPVSFDSGNIPVGQTFQYTFTVPGTYGYHCQYHGGPGTGMYGTVTVTP